MSQLETKSRRGDAKQRRTLSTWAFAGVAGVCLSFVGITALAAPPNLTFTVPGVRPAGDPDVLTKVVRYGELNLQSDEGVVILYKRISAAADYVCSQYVNLGNLRVIAKWRDCHTSAISKAVADVGHPRLTRYVAQIRHEPVESATLAAR
jgi:UrcA family protein